MKKTLLSVALLFNVGIASTFANEIDGITKSVRHSFSQDFKSAKNVKWEHRKNFDKVTFSFNNQVIFAFYNPKGFLVAVSRNIRSENLPLKLQVDLKNSYTSYWISDLFENDAHHEAEYYITLENSEQKLILKSDDSNEWSVYQKINKDVE